MRVTGAPHIIEKQLTELEGRRLNRIREAVRDIERRVRPTICPTFSSSGGDEGLQGRISAEDFEKLVIMAAGGQPGD